jgi:hypothetical protein
MSGFVKAKRAAAKLRITISGQSGAGKTFSALRLARGLARSWDRVAIICSEQGSAHKYSHLGDYSVLVLPDTSPRGYVNAMKLATTADFDVVIVDSATHEWKHCMEWNDKLQQSGKYNKFTAWGIVTPAHDSFVQAIVTHPCHIICTTRRKAEHIQTEEHGKKTIKKVGMQEEQRPGWEYEFDLALFLAREGHLAEIDKTRLTHLDARMPFLIDEKFGEELREWSESGAPAPAPCYTATPDQKRYLYARMLAIGGVSDPMTPTDKEHLNHVSTHIMNWPMPKVEEYLSRLAEPRSDADEAASDPTPDDIAVMQDLPAPNGGEGA